LANELSGVIIALAAGIITNLGIILQKKVINGIPQGDRERKFFRSLVRNPVWFAGFILNQIISAVLVIFAQAMIGPTLMPGLMASGLVVLAIGSVRINRERLEAADYAGILIMILAVSLVGLSTLTVNISGFDFNAGWFFTNSILFTSIWIALVVLLLFLQKRAQRSKAILLILGSGLLFALSNLWISPIVGIISKFFGGTSTLNESILFLIACVLLPAANVTAIAIQQTSYKYGQASTLNTIQNFPTQLTPILIYFFVFSLTPPSDLSTPLLITGIILILASSSLLARRKAELKEIK